MKAPSLGSGTPATQLSEEQALAVMCWAEHRIGEGQRNASAFAWTGRTAHSALHAVGAYFRAIADRQRALRQEISWTRKGWDLQWSAPGMDWQCKELTSSLELFEEGFALKHCVTAYDRDCANGKAAIFQLTRNGQRRLTIEVKISSRLVVQIRGQFNGRAQPEDVIDIKHWCQQLGLQVHPQAW
ncbi:MAG: PcfJ domain-containing protein [Rhodoferax sp.]|nr:PcfJ domain-containing protein [Rhodoferax sp.]